MKESNVQYPPKKGFHLKSTVFVTTGNGRYNILIFRILNFIAYSTFKTQLGQPIFVKMKVLDSNLIRQLYLRKENDVERSHTMKHKTLNVKQRKY